MNKKSLKFNDVICYLIIIYPFLYNISIIIIESGGRRLAQLFFCLLIIGILNNKNKKEIIFLFMVILLCVFNGLIYGLSYVIHMDFYGFIFLLLIMCFFSNKKIINHLEETLKNIKFINISIILFFVTIVLSIFLCNGLKPSSEWGVSIPMLFGPFELPHGLAYELIIIYCLSSILLHCTGKGRYLFVMSVSVLCVAWTGVRSAFLVLIFLVVFDYFSIKRSSLKLIVSFIGALVFIYLFLFTDIITNNPIILKTLEAMKGGSGITNGRGMMNNYLMNVYIYKLSISEKILGVGMVSLREYMYLLTATYLHAHNDVFNILVGHGMVGLIIFTTKFVKFCCHFKNTKIGAVVFTVLFILLFTNGLYMYICFTPCIAIILIYSKCLNVKV